MEQTKLPVCLGPELCFQVQLYPDKWTQSVLQSCPLTEWGKSVVQIGGATTKVYKPEVPDYSPVSIIDIFLTYIFHK